MTAQSEVKTLWILKDAIPTMSDILEYEPTRHQINDFISVVPKSDYDKLKEEVNRLHEKYDFQLLVKRCENLQNLLGECEEAMSDLISMERLIYGRISNLHGGAIINLNNVLQKIKAARGGNE